MVNIGTYRETRIDVVECQRFCHLANKCMCYQNMVVGGQ